MKYWLLTTEYPPFYGGGISTYCQYTAEMLSKKGHEVSVFVQDFSVSGVKTEIIKGVRVVRFTPNATKANKFLGYNAFLSYEFAEVVRQFMVKEGVPSILETQEYSGIAYYVQQFKLLGYPLFKELEILVTCHAPGFLCMEYNQVPTYQFPDYWTGQMEKASIVSADLLIAPSQYFVAEAKKRMYWGDLEAVYVPNPMVMDNQPWKGAPEYVPQRIVSFGKLAPLKGTFEVLRYCESLWVEGHTFQLHLVGGTQQMFHPEGLTMGDLVKRKYQAYLDQGLLVMHDEMSPAEARQFVQSAHAVLVPSLFDNLPYTVLEAMSWGKVVLASQQGGQREVLEDGSNGYLFDHKVPGDFQKKLLHILGLPAAEIKGLGEQARETVLQRFHPEVIYGQKMEVIKDHLASPSKRKRFPFTEEPIVPATVETGDEIANELLSIVIPYYNMGLYIEECVTSVLNADYPQKEILIIDDGSTDPHSRDMLQYLQAKYPVKVISKKNEGLSATRNYGALQAKGKFMAFLDADDAVAPTYYSKAIEVLKTYENVHFVGCWVQYFEGSIGRWPTFNPEPPYLLLHNMMNSSALVYKKQAFLQAGKNDPALIYGMEDWDSVISLVSKGFGGVVLPEFLFHYRIRKESMSRAFTKVKKLFLHKHIAEKHSGIYQKYGVEIAHLSTSNGSLLGFDNPTFAVSAGSGGISMKEHLRNKFKERVKRHRFLRKIAYTIYKKIN